MTFPSESTPRNQAIHHLGWTVAGLLFFLAPGCGRTSDEPRIGLATGGDQNQTGSGGSNSSGGQAGVGGSDGIPDGMGGGIAEFWPSFTCGEMGVYGPDSDGDGYADPSYDGQYSAAEWILLGCEESVPDCDDSASTTHLTGFIDDDGDGLGDMERPVCVEGTDPANGVVLNFLDCDDRDEDKLELGLVDTDGDGFGGARVCMTEEPKALPWTKNRDCDDEDVDVHPDAPDVPGDGQDSNCDDADGVASPVSGFQDVLRGVEQAPSDAVCASTADLHIDEFWREDFFCAGWADPHPILVLLTVQNRGNGASPPATLMVTSVLDEDWSLQLPLPALEPLATTPLYALGRVPHEIIIQIRPTDDDDCAALTTTYSATGVCTTR